MSKKLVSAFSKHNVSNFFELDSKGASAEVIPALIILVIRTLAQHVEDPKTLHNFEREFEYPSSKEAFPTEQSNCASLVI